MGRKPVGNGWFLALCGACEAMAALLFFNLLGHGGPLTFLAGPSNATWLGILILAAGGCSVAAGIWRAAPGIRWLLVSNGLALVALGLIYEFLIRFRIGFATIAALILVMVGSVGRLALERARSWTSAVAGTVCAVFGMMFVGLALHWIRVEPRSQADLLWLGAWFGFSAICMMALSGEQAEAAKPPSPGA